MWGLRHPHIIGQSYREVATGEQNSPRASSDWKPRECTTEVDYPNLFRPVIPRHKAIGIHRARVTFGGHNVMGDAHGNPCLCEDSNTHIGTSQTHVRKP